MQQGVKFQFLNYWVRRRRSAIIWKHWKKTRTRVKELKKRGIYHLKALLTGCCRKEAWRMSNVKRVIIAMPNACFDQLGLFLPGPRSAWSDEPSDTWLHVRRRERR